MTYIFLKPTEDLTWERYVEISNSIDKIDSYAIKKELSEHPALYAYYAGLISVAKRDLDIKQSIMDKLEADIRTRTFTEYKVANKVKPTDKYLEATVLSDPDHAQLKLEIIDLEYKYGLLKSLASSLDHRLACIIQISSNTRSEMKMIHG